MQRRTAMRKLFAIVWMMAACGGGTGEDYYTEEGECQPPAGATAVGGTPAALFDPICFLDTFTELRVVESDAEWQALFDCPQAVPEGVDLSTQRAAVVSMRCTPTNFRFAVETNDEVVVGVKTGISGACIGNVIVVPLPRSTKTVRLAHCWDECHGECPPVP